MNEKPTGELTIREVGARGGKATAATHGTEHYRAIGAKGGAKTKALGLEHFRAIGKKGAAAKAARRAAKDAPPTE